jgi:hypothetical protein
VGRTYNNLMLNVMVYKVTIGLQVLIFLRKKTSKRKAWLLRRKRRILYIFFGYVQYFLFEDV